MQIDSDILTDLVSALSKSVEASTATDDMLALLCVHFAGAPPAHAAELKASIEGLASARAEQAQVTESFAALAHRLSLALSHSKDLPFLSLRKPEAPLPATPQELRSRLRLIHGGRS